MNICGILATLAMALLCMVEAIPCESTLSPSFKHKPLQPCGTVLTKTATICIPPATPHFIAQKPLVVKLPLKPNIPHPLVFSIGLSHNSVVKLNQCSPSARVICSGVTPDPIIISDKNVAKNPTIISDLVPETYKMFFTLPSTAPNPPVLLPSALSSNIFFDPERLVQKPDVGYESTFNFPKFFPIPTPYLCLPPCNSRYCPYQLHPVANDVTCGYY